MKEKNYLWLKLAILLLSGVAYFFFNDDDYKHDASLDISVKAGVHSEKNSNNGSQVPSNNLQVPNATADDKILLAKQKYNEASNAFNRQDYATAIPLYDQAIELNPNYDYAYHDRGLSYYYLKNYPQALTDVNKALSINPNNPLNYNTRGIIYRAMNNYNQAIENFNKAIQLNPNYFEAYANRSLSHFASKNYNQSISDCNMSLQLNPNYADAYLFRGITYGMLLDYNQAIADFSMAIQLSDKLTIPLHLALSYHCRGLCYQKLGENQKAQADLDQAKLLGYAP